MKILWLCNVPIKRIFLMQNIKNDIKGSGGWLEGLSNQLLQNESLHLIYCYLYETTKPELIHDKNENFEYYQIPIKRKRTLECSLNIPEYSKDFSKIICNTAPDIIHIWGTEFKSSWVMTEICKKLNYIDRTIISIQGMVSIYAKHYFNGIDSKWRHIKTVEEIIHRTTMTCDQKTYKERGILEEKAIQNVHNVIGRTDWDQACTKMFNSQIRYFHCNETLRKSFYTDKWDYCNCQKHSIYISQASYPIKGFHMFLKAMPAIIKDYPDTQVYIGGNNRYKSNYIKGSGYFLYLQYLIKRYNLEKTIHFLGTLSEEQVKYAMLNSNVFVSPSNIENSPNSLGEAMLLGVPCITSDVGGVKNMITHEKEGFVYPYNEYYMLAHYVKRVFEMGKEAGQIADTARCHALQTHNPEKNQENLLNIYRKIVNEPK